MAHPGRCPGLRYGRAFGPRLYFEGFDLSVRCGEFNRWFLGTFTVVRQRRESGTSGSCSPLTEDHPIPSRYCPIMKTKSIFTAVSVFTVVALLSSGGLVRAEKGEAGVKESIMVLMEKAREAKEAGRIEEAKKLAAEAGELKARLQGQKVE